MIFQIKNLLKNSSNGVLEVIAKVMAVILRKQNVPEDKIQDMLDQVKRRKNMALFDDWEGFDAQEERKNGGEMKLISQVCKKLKAGWDVEKIKEVFEDDEFDINVICDETVRNGPDYDVDKIFNELAKKQPAESK